METMSIVVVEKALREKVSYETYVTEAVLKQTPKQLPIYVSVKPPVVDGKRFYRRISEGGARTEIGQFFIAGYEQTKEDDWCFNGVAVLPVHLQPVNGTDPVFKVLYEKCEMDKSYAVSKIYGIEASFK